MRKADIERELDEFGRFSEPALLILISLADGPKHGYAMTEDIARIADLRMGPGTLYGAIARLEARGMIEPAGAEDRRLLGVRAFFFAQNEGLTQMACPNWEPPCTVPLTDSVAADRLAKP